MNRRELEKEGVDLKLVFLLLLKKIPCVIVSALIGLILFSTVYGIWHYELSAHPRYQAESKYYIVFEETIEKNYLDYYYNGYTWNDLLSSDPILGYAMTLLPDGYDRTYVDDCVEATILSDVRVLTTTVKADTPEEVTLIKEALEKAVVHFGTEGEKLEQIIVIRSDEPELEKVTNEIVRVALIGAVAFAVLSILVLLVWIAVQDAVYLPEEFMDRYRIPVAGIELHLRRQKNDGGKSEKNVANSRKLPGWERLEEQLLQDKEQNLTYLTDGKEYITASMEELLTYSASDYEKVRSCDGILLRFPQGSANSKKLSHVIKTLEIQKCVVLCAVMTDADPFLIKQYYGY